MKNNLIAPRLRRLSLAPMLLALAAQATASTYEGHMAQIMQVGKRTYIYFVDGEFKGPASRCGYARGMIYSVDNTTPQGHALIARILENSRERGTASGDGRCEPSPMYRDAEGEGLMSYSPK